MPCFKPLQAWRSRQTSSNGKRRLVFNKNEGFEDLPVTVPCGRCIGCRLEKSRQWAMRCVHEASLYDNNCFLTLTYEDKQLPHGGTLVKAHHQKFIKRLRKKISPDKLRYYMCGEYGDETHRPHYHSLLFNYCPADKILVKDGTNKLYQSPSLTETWGHGHVWIGDVTFESAAYVARYVVKKQYGPEAESHYESLDPYTGELCKIIPEYTQMSRRPGIGKGWLEQFHEEVYPEDEVVIRGKLVQPPKYYDAQLDEDTLAEIKRVRKKKAMKYREDQTRERLEVREQVANGRVMKRKN